MRQIKKWLLRVQLIWTDCNIDKELVNQDNAKRRLDRLEVRRSRLISRLASSI